MSDIKNGDRVRLVVEGVAQGNGAYTIVSGDDGQWYAEFKNQYVGNGVTVEKIEPPVEVFKPGDVVRHKDTRSVYALTDKGFVRLSGYGYMPVPNGTEAPFANATTFTSKDYERVDLE